jgi:hypothetical protein
VHIGAGVGLFMVVPSFDDWYVISSPIIGPMCS